jgi:hypothetical protein
VRNRFLIRSLLLSAMDLDRSTVLSLGNSLSNLTNNRWQNIYLFAGACTIAWGIFVFIFLPDDPTRAKIFNDRHTSLLNVSEKTTPALHIITSNGLISSKRSWIPLHASTPPLSLPASLPTVSLELSEVSSSNHSDSTTCKPSEFKSLPDSLDFSPLLSQRISFDEPTITDSI